MELLMAGIALAVGAAASMYRRHRRLNPPARKALAAVRHAPIAEFPDGGVGAIVGHVRYAGDELQAPLTQRVCAYYRVTIESRLPGRDATRESTEENGVDFYIEDDTGRALVSIEHVEVVLARDVETRLGSYGPERHCEGILEDGERVVVFGRGYWSGDFAPQHGDSYRAPARRLLTMRGSEREPLRISDDSALFSRAAR